jgi:hypothetical protein
VFGCRSYHALCRVRGWDKNLPGRILGALPKRKWLKQLQRRGRDLLARLGQHVTDKSLATRRRWPWTWVGDDSLFQKDGRQLGWVGPGWSGQEPRVRRGIAGWLLLVVIGDGKLVVPVDFAVRRPDPAGPGGPCRDNLTWLRVMRDRTWAALQRRRLHLPPPLVVADSGFGASGLMAQVATGQRGNLRVEGKTSSVFSLPDGRQLKGQDVVSRDDWAWHDSAQLPGVRSVRLTAVSPTYGPVTIVSVAKPAPARFYLRCLETTSAAPRLIRAWGRRRWIEPHFRTLKHLLATEACQVQGEDADYGHLVLRLLAALALLYTARVLFKGQVTLEEILVICPHHWRFLDSELLELQGLSWHLRGEAAGILAVIEKRKSGHAPRGTRRHENGSQ